MLKKTFATYLIFACLIFRATAQMDMESIAKQELMKHLKQQSFQSKRGLSDGVNVIFAQLYLAPNIQTGALNNASVNYHFIANRNLNSISLDLRKELTVDSVIYKGQKTSFIHSNSHQLNINFPQQIQNQNTDSFKIYYKGMPNRSAGSYFRNVIASGPTIATLSQPYGAHFWWPCFENLDDKIDSLDVSLLIDTPYIGVANGVLFSSETIGTKKLYNYKHRYPVVTYLIAIAVSKYDFYVQNAFLPSIQKNIPIVNYTFPLNNLESNKTQTLETVKIMRLFDSLFGTYPFHKEHYGHMQFSNSGGMEHQTISSMSNFNYDLIAHELAHQWFGDKITCGSWKELWLNEGFATYLNLLCYDFLKPREEWLSQIKKVKEDVLKLDNGSVYAYDTINEGNLFNYRTTYQKGAMILHQMRWYLGDKAFFKALKNYALDATSAYGFTNQNKLKRHLEIESGISLDDYFNDWVFNQGHPNYLIQWEQKGPVLVINIKQTPSHQSVAEFNVPLPLLVSGKQKDSLLRIPINGLNFKVEIPLNFIVKTLDFDPYHQVLGKASVQFPKLNEQNILIFPNPTNSNFYFSISTADIVGYEIIDAVGRKVLEKSFNTPVYRETLESIDCQILSKGIYTIKFKTTDNNLIIKKIITQ